MSKKSPTALDDLSRDYVLSRVRYERESGEFFWLPLLGATAAERRWNSRYAGKRAGAANSAGYVYLAFSKRRYAAHRLAWLIETGEWPVSDIDHIDRCRAHNWISNLRLATDSQNQANTDLGATNSSGSRGVFWHKSNKRWCAAIRMDGKRLSLGSFHEKDDAIKAYENAFSQQFAGFLR